LNWLVKLIENNMKGITANQYRLREV